ncbi:MAG TPA: hypothetical protein VK112_01105, partial [Fodinibius sp.]|nr:hypothetical protein [Fodinibius sp.]
ILPDGNYNSILDQKQLKRIKEWISAGGRLIALGGANRFLAAKEGFQLTRKDVEADSVALSPARSFDERQRRQISSLNTGSIYKITMDSTHPLAFGYDSLYFSLKLNADAYHFLEDGWNVGVAGKDAHTSGFVGFKAKKKLKDTLTFGVQNMGSGSVIYMIDNPLFRGFWQNGKLLMANAIFLVGN